MMCYNNQIYEIYLFTALTAIGYMSGRDPM